MDEQDVLPYREVLWPRIWVWLLPVGFAGCLGAAYGYAYGARTGWLVGLATAELLLLGLFLLGRSVIEVDSRQVRAARAVLPSRYIGTVRALDAAETFRARTADADPRAFHLLRGWASPASVVMEITDPEDPHPYWMLSTRNPTRLADALQAARAAAPAR